MHAWDWEHPLAKPSHYVPNRSFVFVHFGFGLTFTLFSYSSPRQRHDSFWHLTQSHFRPNNFLLQVSSALKRLLFPLFAALSDEQNQTWPNWEEFDSFNATATCFYGLHNLTHWRPFPLLSTHTPTRQIQQFSCSSLQIFGYCDSPIVDSLELFLFYQRRCPLHERSWRLRDVHGLSSANNLQQNNPKTENVGFRAQFAGCRVTRIQITDCSGRLTGVAPAVRDGEAEIRQFQIPIRVEQDVFGLDVSVNNQRVGLVKELHRTCNLHDDLEAFGPSEGWIVSEKQIVKAPIGHELHYEKLVVATVNTDAKKVDHERVLAQRMQNSGFVLELGIVWKGWLELGLQRLLHGNHGVVVEYCFVDGPMRSFAYEPGRGEAIGGV